MSPLLTNQKTGLYRWGMYMLQLNLYMYMGSMYNVSTLKTNLRGAAPRKWYNGSNRAWVHELKWLIDTNCIMFYIPPRYFKFSIIINDILCHCENIDNFMTNFSFPRKWRSVFCDVLLLCTAWCTLSVMTFKCDVVILSITWSIVN